MELKNFDAKAKAQLIINRYKSMGLSHETAKKCAIVVVDLLIANIRK